MCERLAEVFYPERGGFFSPLPADVERFDTAFDQEPARLRRDVANMYGAFMRPRGREWFKITVGEPDEEDDDLSWTSTLWLEDATRRLRRIIYRQGARFAEQMGLDDHDYVTFGSSVSRVVLSGDETGIVFRNLHLKNVVWGENEDGEVDAADERLLLPARQMMAMFGPERLHRDVKDALDNSKPGADPYREFPVRRRVMPAAHWEWERGKSGRLPPRSTAFASVYLCETGKQVLAENRLSYFPYHIRRWSRAQAQPWGLSIITPVALADARVLDTAERSICEAIEMITEPPLVVKNEAVLGSMKLMAGGVTVGRDYDYRMGKPIETAYEPGNPAFGMEYTKQKREFLARVFLENPLRLPQDREMTLGEVNERIEEISRAAAPVFEPGEADNQRLLEKPFVLALEKGAFLPTPEELQGAEVRFELDTLITQQIDKLRVIQAKATGEYVALMANVDPDAPKYVAWPQLHRDALKGLGPQRWQRDPAEVEEEASAAAEEDARMNALAMAAEIGKTGVAKAITDKALAQPGGEQIPAAVAGALEGMAA